MSGDRISSGGRRGDGPAVSSPVTATIPYSDGACQTTAKQRPQPASPGPRAASQRPLGRFSGTTGGTAAQPTRFSASIRVVRLTPKVRQAAASDMPPSSAARMAASVSSEIARGRPAPPAAGRGGLEPRHHPLADQRVLVLRQRPEHGEQQLPLQRGRVHVLGQGAEGHAALAQIPHDRQ